MIRINVKVDDTNIQRRLRRIQTNIEANGKASVTQVGMLVRDRLKLYMPKKTKESADSIMVKDMTSSKKGSSLVVTQSFKPHPSKTWNGVWFNIPRWALTSRKAIGHFRTGNIPALRNVVPEARIEFRKRIRNDINKSIKVN